MASRSKIIFTLLLVLLHLAAGTAAFSQETTPEAAPAGGNDEVVALNHRIMLECINLARFNLYYHAALNKKTFYQQWLYPANREAGTALSFANTIVDLNQRGRAWNDPSLINKSVQKAGVKCALTGQAITGGSSAYALATNLVQSLIAARRGYSRGKSLQTVKAFSDKIDALLLERDQVIADNQIQDRDNVYAVQKRMLDHVRNQLIFEYKTWSIRSRAMEWSEDTFYAIDSAQGFTQLASSCLSLRAFDYPPIGGAAAFTNLVANGMVTVNPIVRSAAGKWMAHRQERLLNKVFPRAAPKQIGDVLSEWGLSPEIAAKDNSLSPDMKELGFLIRRSAAIDGPLNAEMRKLEKLRRIADQQTISGPLIGLTGVARGILNTTAFYTGNNLTSSSSGSQSKLDANRMNATGRIVQAAGQSYSLVLTPATAVRHFLYRRKQSKAGLLPEQVFKARLERLDAFEARIKSNKF